MKNIRQIRLTNLEHLVKHAGGRKKFLEQNKETEITFQDSYFNQLFIEKGRGIGDKTARKLETMAKKPKNWLDNPHQIEISEEKAEYNLKNNYILIPSIQLPLINWNQINYFINSTIKNMEYDKMTIEDKGWSGKSFIIKMTDSSCAPIIEAGDYIIVDPEKQTQNRKVLVSLQGKIRIMECIKLDKQYLKFINNELPPQEITETLDYKIHGTIVGSMKPIKEL